MRKPKARRRLKQPLDPVMVERIVVALPDQLSRDLCRFQYGTGLRPGEALRARA